MDNSRAFTLVDWIVSLKQISSEFPGGNVSIGTALRRFETQLKEFEKQK